MRKKSKEIMFENCYGKTTETYFSSSFTSTVSYLLHPRLHRRTWKHRKLFNLTWMLFSRLRELERYLIRKIFLKQNLISSSYKCKYFYIPIDISNIIFSTCLKYKFTFIRKLFQLNVNFHNFWQTRSKKKENFFLSSSLIRNEHF